VQCIQIKIVNVWQYLLLNDITRFKFPRQLGRDSILGDLSWDPIRGEIRPYLSITAPMCKMKTHAEETAARASLWANVIADVGINRKRSEEKPLIVKKQRSGEDEEEEQ
jgi:hypothetical protein